jgi:hypothetical protein
MQAILAYRANAYLVVSLGAVLSPPFDFPPRTALEWSTESGDTETWSLGPVKELSLLWHPTTMMETVSIRTARMIIETDFMVLPPVSGKKYKCYLSVVSSSCLLLHEKKPILMPNFC